jgi:hypothetical protein
MLRESIAAVLVIHHGSRLAQGARGYVYQGWPDFFLNRAFRANAYCRPVAVNNLNPVTAFIA